MLSKKERLSRDEFNRFFSIGKRTHSPGFQVIFSSHPKLHAAVVVSKKIAKHAVKRNKIRRQIYDCVRNYAVEKKIHGVFIFLVKQPVLAMRPAEIRQGVRSHLDTLLKTRE